MGLVVITAGNGHVRQTCPPVRDKTAGTFEAENPCAGLRGDADGISKAFAEVAAAITSIIGKLLHRNYPMRLHESLPRPRDFSVDVGRSQGGDEQLIQDRKSLLPTLRTLNLFYEIQRSRSPNVGEVHYERC